MQKERRATLNTKAMKRRRHSTGGLTRRADGNVVVVPTSHAFDIAQMLIQRDKLGGGRSKSKRHPQPDEFGIIRKAMSVVPDDRSDEEWADDDSPSWMQSEESDVGDADIERKEDGVSEAFSFPAQSPAPSGHTSAFSTSPVRQTLERTPTDSRYISPAQRSASAMSASPSVTSSRTSTHSHHSPSYYARREQRRAIKAQQKSKRGEQKGKTDREDGLSRSMTFRSAAQVADTVVGTTMHSKVVGVVTIPTTSVQMPAYDEQADISAAQSRYSQRNMGLVYDGRVFWMDVTHPCRRFCIDSVESPWFERLVLFTILLNSVFLAMDDPTVDGTTSDIVDVSEYVFTSLFALEMVIKVIAMGFWQSRHAYIRDNWNKLDFLVVVSGFIALAPGVNNVSAIRSVRALRPLKTINQFPDVRVLVSSLLNSITMMRDVLALFLFVFFLFGVVGMQLFAGALQYRCVDSVTGVTIDDELTCTTDSGAMYLTCPAGSVCMDVGDGFARGVFGFDNIGQSWLTIFACLTLEGWTDITYAVVRAVSWPSVIFFVLLIIIGAFIVVNLVTGVVYTSYLSGRLEEESKYEALRKEKLIELMAIAKVKRMQGRKPRKNRRSSALRKQRNRNAQNGNDPRTSPASPSRTVLSQNYGIEITIARAFPQLPEVRESIEIDSGGEEDDDEPPPDVDVAAAAAAATATAAAAAAGPEIPPMPDLERLEPLPRAPAPASAIDSYYSDTGMGTLTTSPAAFPSTQSSGGAAGSGLKSFPSKEASAESNNTTGGAGTPSGTGTDISGISDFDDSGFEEEEEQDQAVCCQACDDAAHRLFVWCCSEPFRVAYQAFQQKCVALSKDDRLNVLIMSVIVLNTLLLCTQFAGQPDYWTEVHDDANYVFTSIFAVEVIIKFVGLPRQEYFEDRFNLFDFVIVLVSVLEIILARTGNSKNQDVSALRAFRLLRVFKLAKQWKQLQLLLRTISMSLGSLVYFVAIAVIMIFVFALLGMQLFGGQVTDADGNVPRANFDSFAWSLVTVFQIVTGENWNEVLTDTMASVGPGAAVYFVVLYCLGNLIILNLFLAVLLSNFEITGAEQVAEEMFDVSVDSEEANMVRRGSQGAGPPVTPVAKRFHALVEQAAAVKRSQSQETAGSADAPAPAAAVTVVQPAQENSEELNQGMIMRVTVTSPSVGQEEEEKAPKGTSSVSAPPVAGGSVELMVLPALSDPSDVGDVVAATAPDNNNGVDGTVMVVDDDMMLEALDAEAERRRQDSRATDRLSQLVVASPVSAIDERKDIEVLPSSAVDMNANANANANANVNGNAANSDSEVSEIEDLREDRDSGRGSGGAGNGQAQPHLLDVPAISPRASRDSEISVSVGGTRRKRHRRSGSLSLLEAEVVTEPIVYEDRRLHGRSFFCFTQDNRWRQVCADVIAHPYFELFILFLIVISTIALAIETPDLSQDTLHALDVLNFIIVVVFTLEAMLKIFTFGLVVDEGSYLRDPWNVLDFVIVLLSVFDEVFGGASFVRAFRALRALRPLRMVKRYESLRVVVESIFQALPSIFQVLLVALLFWIIFGILGVQLFGGLWYQCETVQSGALVYNAQGKSLNKTECYTYCATQTGSSYCKWKNPEVGNFDNIFNAMLVMFELSTMERWPVLMYRGVDTTGNEDEGPRRDAQPWYAFFFVLYVIVGSIFIMNLFVGVVIENFITMKEKLSGSAFLTPRQKMWLELQRMLLHAKQEYKTSPPIRSLPGDSLCCGRVKERVRDHTPWFDRYLSQLDDGLYELRCAVYRLVTQERFDSLISMCIVLNILIMAMYYHDASDQYLGILFRLNLVFTVIFALEVVLKLTGLGAEQYFGSGWNSFDFIIVMGSIVGLLLSLVTGQDSGFDFTVLRMFRIARIIRVVQRTHRLRSLIRTLILSFPALVNVGGLLFLLYFIYAAAGVALFYGAERREYITDIANFDNFGYSLLTLFRASTGENWNGLMRDLMRRPADECSGDTACGSYGAVPFFVSFQIFGQFMMLNLFIAVVLEEFENLADRDAYEKGLPLRVQDLNQYADAWSSQADHVPWYMFWKSRPEWITWQKFQVVLRQLKGPLAIDPRRSLLAELDDLPIPLHPCMVRRVEQDLHTGDLYEVEEPMLCVNYGEGLLALILKAFRQAQKSAHDDDKVDEEIASIPPSVEQHRIVRQQLQQKFASVHQADRPVARLADVVAASMLQAAWRGLQIRRRLRAIIEGQIARASSATRYHNRQVDVVEEEDEEVDEEDEKEEKKQQGGNSAYHSFIHVGGDSNASEEKTMPMADVPSATEVDVLKRANTDDPSNLHKFASTGAHDTPDTGGQDSPSSVDATQEREEEEEEEPRIDKRHVATNQSEPPEQLKTPVDHQQYEETPPLPPLPPMEPA